MAKQQIVIATDLLPDGQKRKSDLVSQLVYYITDTLAVDYLISFQQVSREREWRLIEQQQNICVYNKSKTPAREKIASFANLPLIYYAPNRLITTRPLTQQNEAELISIKEVTSAGLMIGAIKGRHYSRELNEYIELDSDKFYLGAGSYKAERLHKMFVQGKLDGIIEYSSVFKTRQNISNSKIKAYTYALHEAQNAVQGFIACSQSELTQQFLTAIERVMLSKAYRVFAKKKISEASDYIESDFIIEQLGY